MAVGYVWESNKKIPENFKLSDDIISLIKNRGNVDTITHQNECSHMTADEMEFITNVYNLYSKKLHDEIKGDGRVSKLKLILELPHNREAIMYLNVTDGEVSGYIELCG